MKRSRRIRLVLVGSLSAGALAGCDPSAGRKPPVSTEAVYTNNYYLPGAGYYHAPFRAWYPFPYNHFNPDFHSYYYGGQWMPTPHESITNVSAPTAEAVQQVQARRTDVSRGGFGGTGRGYSTWS